MWTIYKHTFPNGKIYIGQTKQTLEERFCNGKGYRGCPYINHAIEKYGWTSVKTEIIQTDIPSQEEANKLEIYYIEKYEARNPNIGYNIAIGGGVVNKIKDEAIYQKWTEGLSVIEISRLLRYDRHVVSDILKQYNVTQKEIHDRKSKNTGLMHRKYDYEAIYQYWNQYHDVEKVLKHFNCCYDTLLRVFKNYNVSKEERAMSHRAKLQQSKKGNNKKQVMQFDLNDNYIQTFNSIVEANLYLNKNREADRIIAACKGRAQQAYGYKWKYAND